MDKLIQRFNIVFVTGFIVLCAAHYFSQRPLWLDEDYVYQNIISLNYSQLFGPLQPAQSFPRVYLCLIKFISSFFNNHLLALRLLSFLCMIGAVLVWRRLYQRSTTEVPHILPILLFSWFCSYWMVYYGAELKPYSMDVLSVGLFGAFFYLQSRYLEHPPDLKLYVLAVFIPSLLLFSYACIFVFWIACYNFLWISLKNKRIWPVFFISSFSSLIIFIIFYVLDIRHSITVAGVNYWESYFLCTKSVGCFFETFGEGVKRYAVYWWGAQKIFRRAAVIFIPVLIYGLYRYGWKEFRKNNFLILNINSLSIVIFLEFIVLGLLKKYPFTGERITLFFAPLVFYLVVRVLNEGRRIKYLGNILFVYYIGYCCVNLCITIGSYFKLYL